MNYDFFADKADKIKILEYIFGETDLKIFDVASPYGQEIREFKQVSDIETTFDLENEVEFVGFNLWTPRFGAPILFQRIELDPRSCKGHTFRYETNGWGLVQLYFGGLKDNKLYHSHIGHFDERGALSRDRPDHLNGIATEWNWKEITQTSRKLKYQLHQKMAVRKIGSYGVLPGADTLSRQGINLGRVKLD